MINGKYKAVILDGYAENPGDLSWSALEELCETTVYSRTPPDLVLERAQGADIIVTNKTPLTRQVLEKLPDLKFIALLSTGYNIADCAYARERGIPVSNIPAYSTNAVAQLVFAFILEFCNRVALHDASVKSGDWCKCLDFCYWKAPLTELGGKTLGIIGFGKIGRAVSRIALAMNMKVLCYAPSGTKPDAPGVEFAGRDTVISNSDFITLHCPLTEETTGMINRDFISKMKPEAYLINTSRGPVVNEAALADALNTGRIAGAAADVLSTEPPTLDNPMLTAKNCLLTPHIAWAGYETRARLMDIFISNVKAFVDGAPQNVVN
ncbi:MAG: D-2-hydroxyacid dehydrogenase [Clostridiales bacterium]|nr:D-2-hydroxyacid dehydrogenase [Clostridiales bacterium]